MAIIINLSFLLWGSTLAVNDGKLDPLLENRLYSAIPIIKTRWRGVPNHAPQLSLVTSSLCLACGSGH